MKENSWQMKNSGESFFDLSDQIVSLVEQKETKLRSLKPFQRRNSSILIQKGRPNTRIKKLKTSKSFSKGVIKSQKRSNLVQDDLLSNSDNEIQNSPSPKQKYSFEPILTTSGRKVQINQTDLSKIGIKLDVTKDVPLVKPQSAYVLFGNQQRIQIQEKYPGIRVTEVVKMIAKEWQRLTKPQKQKYKEAAKRDKDRFANELTKLGKTGDDTLLYKIPKKPLTAYMFFVRETRTRVAKEQPEIAPLDIMKVVGQIWQKQTETDLVQYKQMAELDLERYQKEMHQFIEMLNHLRQNQPQNQETSEQNFHMQNSPEKAPIDENDIANQLSNQKDVQMSPPKKPYTNDQNYRSSILASSYESPMKSEMRMSDIKPLCGSSGGREGGGHLRPKKPLSAYIFFSQEQREKLKKENPHWSTREVMKQVSDQWALLQRNQKKSYVEKAWEDKKRFESQIKFLRDFKQPLLQQQNQPKPSFVRKLDFGNLGQNDVEKRSSKREHYKEQSVEKDKEKISSNIQSKSKFDKFLPTENQKPEPILLENFFQQPEIFTNNVTPVRPKAESPHSYELFYFDPNGQTIPLTPINQNKKEETNFDDFFFGESYNIQESSGYQNLKD